MGGPNPTFLGDVKCLLALTGVWADKGIQSMPQGKDTSLVPNGICSSLRLQFCQWLQWWQVVV